VKKIPSLFSRDPNNPRVLSDAYHALADWVVQGAGVATRKWDGTAVLVRDGQLFARFDAKHGKQPPPNFVPAQDPDPATGHHPGWVPATRPEDRWLRAAADAAGGVAALASGTYEACGPKIGGNPERLADHRLIRHGTDVIEDVPRDKVGLIEFFTTHDIEGVVWWQRLGDDDSPVVKITGAALGVKRPAPTADKERE
jgi:hypothetical protein